MSAALSAQQSQRHEIERDMPLFLDSLKQELTYPLAWGNSEISDFETWREVARKKVTVLMLTPPPKASSYNIKVLAEEKRDGYTARKIEFNLTRYSCVTAYLLVPDGDGPFPAVVALQPPHTTLAHGPRDAPLSPILLPQFPQLLPHPPKSTEYAHQFCVGLVYF